MGEDKHLKAALMSDVSLLYIMSLFLYYLHVGTFLILLINQIVYKLFDRCRICTQRMKPFINIKYEFTVM